MYVACMAVEKHRGVRRLTDCHVIGCLSLYARELARIESLTPGVSSVCSSLSRAGVSSHAVGMIEALTSSVWHGIMHTLAVLGSAPHVLGTRCLRLVWVCTLVAWLYAMARG